MRYRTAGDGEEAILGQLGGAGLVHHTRPGPEEAQARCMGEQHDRGEDQSDEVETALFRWSEIRSPKTGEAKEGLDYEVSVPLVASAIDHVCADRESSWSP